MASSALLIAALENSTDHDVTDVTIDIKIVENLLNGDGGLVDGADQSDLQTPLMWAASNGRYDIAALLIKKGANVNARDVEGKTPLMYAAQGGNADICELLFKNGASVDAASFPDFYSSLAGANVLGYAVNAFWNRKGVISWLLKNGDIKINSRDARGWTALSRCDSSVEVVKYLLEKGADPNIRNGNGTTPLMAAASHDYLANVKALLAAGADIDAKDSHGKTALSLAEENKATTVVEFLKSKMPSKS